MEKEKESKSNKPSSSGRGKSGKGLGKGAKSIDISKPLANMDDEIESETYTESHNKSSIGLGKGGKGLGKVLSKERLSDKSSSTGRGKGGKGLGKGSKKESAEYDNEEDENVDDIDINQDESITADNSAVQKKENLKIKEEMIASFGGSDNGIDVVFSFDTTGSMYSCLARVRKNVAETVQKLLKDIPKIRIGIIVHGDYCDQEEYGYVVSKLDFCTDVNAICEFVRCVGSTGGGDRPEAYELVLHEARILSWNELNSKALVVIGDDIPHPPSFTTEDIYWRTELEKLVEMGVKVYSVQALNNQANSPFYKELAKVSGGVKLELDDFKLITDMFMAVCYKEASGEKLTKFKEEVTKEGRMTEAHTKMFENLENQPQLEIEEDIKEGWWDSLYDKGTPQYQWNYTTKLWENLDSKVEHKPVTELCSYATPIQKAPKKNLSSDFWGTRDDEDENEDDFVEPTEMEVEHNEEDIDVPISENKSTDKRTSKKRVYEEDADKPKKKTVEKKAKKK